VRAVRIFPELVTGRLDDFIETGWNVREGHARRGEAHCDFPNRIIRVPLGSSDLDRVVRAHELVHAGVSPHDIHPRVVLEHFSPRVLECAEEFRVNVLLARLGFNVAALTDGSERAAGQRMAADDQWANAVSFFVAITGTGAERLFLSGVRRERPEWARALTMVKKRLEAMVGPLSTSEISSTVRRLEEGEYVNRGFRVVTVPVAELVATVCALRAPRDADDLRSWRRSLAPGARRGPSGRFADLIIAPHDLDRHQTGSASIRGRRPSSTGAALTAPHRLITDPRRRVFSSMSRRRGGIVLLDLSGSMDLGDQDVESLLRASPGATILGYSHRPGDLTGLPNAWLIASRGRRSWVVPTGNVGNGVDGPALKWALSRRNGGEAVIWVTDGQITDSHDHPDMELAAECAHLVRRHDVRLVRTLAEAVHVLRGRTPSRARSEFGRLGRALAEHA
jgi:hypothetical protein